VNWRGVSSKSAKAFLTECQQLEVFMSALVKGLPVTIVMHTRSVRQRRVMHEDTERY